MASKATTAPKAVAQLVEVTCERCGVVVVRPAWRRRRFCSVACANRGRPYVGPFERSWRFIEADEETGCWLWTGHLNRAGYGRIMGPGHRALLTHRMMWEALTGVALPPGYVLDHLCRVRRCCNPAHLEPVTQGENLWRGWALKRVPGQCVHGHPLTTETLWVSARGRLICKVCARAHKRRAYQRARERARAGSG